MSEAKGRRVGASDEPVPSTWGPRNQPEKLKYQKIPGFANMAGQDYEIKLASLLYLRAVQSRGTFYMGTNVAGAGAMDDIVFKYKSRGEQEYRTAFIQCKHKSSINKRIRLKDLAATKGDYSLEKYYTAYMNLCDVKKKSVLLDNNSEQCDYIIYTNSVLDRKLISDSSEETNSVARIKRIKLFATGQDSEKGPAILKESTLRDVKNAVEKKSGKKGEEFQDFLSRLQWFTNQSSEKELDAFIEAEINTALGLNKKDAKQVGKEFVEKMKCWWAERGEAEVLTETSQVWSDIVDSRIDLMNARKRNEKEALNINFTDQEIDSFDQSLSSSSPVINVTSTNVKMTALKVSQMLDEMGYNRYIFVGQSEVTSRKPEVLCLWKSDRCDTLMVECSTDTTPLANELDELRRALPHKKLLLLSQSALPGYQQHLDHFTWNQLDAPSQQRLSRMTTQLFRPECFPPTPSFHSAIKSPAISRNKSLTGWGQITSKAKWFFQNFRKIVH